MSVQILQEMQLRRLSFKTKFLLQGKDYIKNKLDVTGQIKWKEKPLKALGAV